MAIVQPNYKEKRLSSIKQSVWLVIDVPGMAAERIPDLQRDMRDFANKWVADDPVQHSDPYDVSMGVTETKKLRIFVQER